MKPPRFAYHDPETVPEVLALLRKLENSRVLAGGQSLMPMLNMRLALPDDLIDLNRVKALSYLNVRGGDKGDALEIGAMTRQREIEFSDLVRERCPLMHEAILQVGHRQTRNRGTLGGSLCQLDPSAELVAVAAALDATIAVAGPKGTREIAFADFPKTYMTPAIGADELVTGVKFALWPKSHGWAFVEFARRHGDFAIVSAAALLQEDRNGKIARASVTLGGVAAAPVRMKDVEKALVGQTASDALFREACEACRKIEALEDVHAPASYRRHLAAVLSRRALERAHARI
jgi:aerobic carbon-monoxide dehydrogenase medium subunit